MVLVFVLCARPLPLGEGWGEGLAKKQPSLSLSFSLGYAARPHPRPLSQMGEGKVMNSERGLIDRRPEFASPRGCDSARPAFR